MAAPIEHTKSVRMGYFPYKVYVILSSDIDESARRRSACIGPHVVDGSEAFRYEDVRGRGACYLFFPIDVDAGFITHEAHHAVESMFRYMSSKGDEEIAAYSQQYLVTAIHKLQAKAK